MGARHTPSGIRALLAALAAGICCLARADLAQNSPFLAAGAKAAEAAGGPAGPIELRGIVAMPDGSSYCIYDVAKKRSTWVGMNEAGNDFVVKSADASGEGVVVDYHGSPLKLTLHQAKVVSSGPAAGPGGPSPAISSTVVPNPTPGDEQHRLDAVAQEVRRRRMEREKAMQAGRPGPPGVPPVVPNR